MTNVGQFFEPSAEQQALCRAIRDFGQTLNEGLIARDSAAAFDRGIWKRCAQFGILGLPIPAEYGGTDQDLTTTLLAMIELGCSCRDNGLLFSLNAQLCSFELPILYFGTEEQKQRYLPSVVSGDTIGAHAVTEPGSGSDAMSMKTRAVRMEDHYILTGTKTFVTDAPVADVAIVFATVDPFMRSAAVTAFLVERGLPGLTFSKPIGKMGLRTSPMGEVSLDECRVPVSSRLGAEGAGSSIFTSAMEWERICIFAAHLGAMERLFEETMAYAKTRKQFGQPISQYESISSKLVNMKVDIEIGKLLLLKAAAKKDAGEAAVLEAAIAKLFISEAHVREALDAVQIHGAYGYTTEYQVERELRDAIPGTIYSGTSEIQRKIIARLLGL
jgi:alkylation response protein AidB-like acyl-CoA dehydrogenase